MCEGEKKGNYRHVKNNVYTHHTKHNTPPMPSSRPDEKVVKTIRIWGALAIGLLTLLNVLTLISLIGSANSVGEMLELSRDMNASTSTTMGRIHELLKGVDPSQPPEIVNNVWQISADAKMVMGTVAHNGNVTALINGIKKFVLSINSTVVASALGDAATITHTLTGSAEHVREVIAIIDLDVIRSILTNAQNITAEVRRVVASHNLRLGF